MKKQTEEGLKFSELVEIRREEMKSVLPGFYTQVTDGVNEARVESPSAEERR